MWMQTKLQPYSCVHRRFHGENVPEAVAVLKEDQYPKHTGQQTRSNARRRHRQVKRQDVVEHSGQQRQGKGHEKARKQQQPTEDLYGEKESGKVRCADGNKELHCERIRRWRLVDKVEKSV